MAQITGKYEHVSDSPEFAEYVKQLGAPEPIATGLLKSKPTVTISEAGGVWTINTKNDGKESNSTFKLGELYDEPTTSGVVFKSITKREGDKFIIESSFEGKKRVRVYEFNATGYVVHLKDESSGVSATRTYKRV
ncbi:fatty acid-binding protein 12-like [Athalia rosae]|uniref:fatty acid-binding protein 12-like n=1 Tax=Athalia rosae TaxID=37344 RepID=UPI000626193F|nr:fatty acid-binding protein 12-like [Athalia rosae]